MDIVFLSNFHDIFCHLFGKVDFMAASYLLRQLTAQSDEESDVNEEIDYVQDVIIPVNDEISDDKLIEATIWVDFAFRALRITPTMITPYGFNFFETRRDDPRIIDCLLAIGVDLFAQEGIKTLLHSALERRQIRVFQRVLELYRERNISVDSKNLMGVSPLTSLLISEDYSMDLFCVYMSEELLNAGADPLIEIHPYKTCFHYAKYHDLEVSRTRSTLTVVHSWSWAVLLKSLKILYF